jgi:hypothetical protein
MNNKFPIRLLYNFCPYCNTEGSVQRLGVFVPSKLSKTDIKKNISYTGKVKDIAYCNNCNRKINIDSYKEGVL